MGTERNRNMLEAISAVARDRVRANLEAVAMQLAIAKTANVNRIICGDAIEVMRQIPDGSIDLIITSPPYNIRNTTGSTFRLNCS